MNEEPQDYKSVIDKVFAFRFKPKSRPKQHQNFHATNGNYLLDDVGTRIARCSLENYVVTVAEQQNLKNSIEAYSNDIYGAMDECRQLLLYGSVGCGKDHLVMHCARAALNHGYKVRCISGPKFRAQVRDSIGHERQAELLQPYIDCDFLWLSDPVIDGKSMSSFQAEVMYSLIDERWRNCMPIWTTCNVHSAEEAISDLGAPVFDRLKHNALALHCDWESSRKVTAKK